MRHVALNTIVILAFIGGVAFCVLPMLSGTPASGVVAPWAIGLACFAGTMLATVFSTLLTLFILRNGSAPFQGGIVRAGLARWLPAFTFWAARPTGAEVMAEGISMSLVDGDDMQGLEKLFPIQTSSQLDAQSYSTLDHRKRGRAWLPGRQKSAHYMKRDP